MLDIFVIQTSVFVCSFPYVYQLCLLGLEAIQTAVFIIYGDRRFFVTDVSFKFSYVLRYHGLLYVASFSYYDTGSKSWVCLFVANPTHIPTIF